MSETSSEALPERDIASVQEQSISPPVSSRPSVGSHTSSHHSRQDAAPLPGVSIHSQSPSQSTPVSQRNSLERNRKPAHQGRKFERLRTKLQLKISSTADTEPKSWWWWWEILAVFLSIACMCGLVGFLIRIDNLPLQQWNLPIEPNSLMAALITIAKASMMVAVASCIGQLKWRHFMIRSQRLSDLQLFDDASRGPWGSAMLLWSLCTLRVRAIVTFGFALVTIVALGIDTSTQQILKFPPRESLLTNATVELGAADTYASKGLSANQNYNISNRIDKSNLFTLESSIINGATGSVYKPYYSCPQPASRCQWGNFTTLGICSGFGVTTDITAVECVRDNVKNGLNCTYIVPKVGSTVGIANLTITWKIKGGNSSLPFGTTHFESLFSPMFPYNTRIGYFSALNATTDGYARYNSSTGEYDPPPVNAYSGFLSWCSRTYNNVTSSQSEIYEEAVSTEELTLMIRGDEIEEVYFVANSTGHIYKVQSEDIYNLGLYLSILLNTLLVFDQGDSLPEWWDILDMGMTLRYSNMDQVMKGIADTLTNQIRSNKGGDNFNASTIKGEAFFEETYIHVRWGWMTLPLAEVLLTAILLVVSIVITRKQPLFKESVMALLMSELEGWSEDELDVPRPQTQEKLDELADKMTAKFEVDDTGRLRFEKV
ncbi:hypothetical protein F4805DRAFT_178983 [Annulohypoxylon moriforme]|nr:hypothetical protein F4805DRAFT_178983 [Annulohypoxylon moriforme]